MNANDSVEILLRLKAEGREELERLEKAARGVTSAGKEHQAYLQSTDALYAKNVQSITALTASVDKNTAALERHKSATKEAQAEGGKWAQYAEQVKGFIESPLQAAGNAAEGLLNKLGPVGTGVVAGAAIFATYSKVAMEAARSLGEFATETENMSIRTGLTTKQVGEYSYAAHVAGVETGVYETAMRMLSKGLEDTGTAGGKARAQLDAMGVSSRDLATGAFRPTSDILQEIAQKLEGVEGQWNKVAAVQAIFGRSGIQLLPVLERLSGSLEEAKRLGFGVDQESISRWEQYHTMMVQVDTEWEILKRKFKEPLAASVMYVVKHVLNADANDENYLSDDIGKQRLPGTIIANGLSAQQRLSLGAMSTAGLAANPRTLEYNARMAAYSRTKEGLESLVSSQSQSASEAKSAYDSSHTPEDEKKWDEATAQLRVYKSELEDMNQREKNARQLELEHKQRIKQLNLEIETFRRTTVEDSRKDIDAVSKAYQTFLDKAKGFPELIKSANGDLDAYLAKYFPANEMYSSSFGLNKPKGENQDHVEREMNIILTSLKAGVQAFHDDKDASAEALNGIRHRGRLTTAYSEMGIGIETPGGLPADNEQRQEAAFIAAHAALTEEIIQLTGDLSKLDKTSKDWQDANNKLGDAVLSHQQLEDRYAQTLANRQISTMSEQESYAGRKASALAMPGDEARVITDSYARRVQYAQEVFNLDHDRSKLNLDLLKAEHDQELSLLELRKQGLEQFRQSMAGLIDALQANGSTGGKDFAMAFLRNIEKTVAVNLSGELFKSMRDKLNIGSMIPGQVDADGKLTTMGRVLQGTPLGKDMSQMSLERNTSSTDLNTAALQANTSARTGGVAGISGGLSGVEGVAESMGLPHGSGNGDFGGEVTGSSSGSGFKIPTGALKGIGIGSALAAGSYGMYSGIHAGGAQGGLTAAASAAGMIGAVLPMVSKALAAAGPIGMAAGMALSMVGMFLGDPKKKRDTAETNAINAAHSTMPDSISRDFDVSGNSVDYDYRGRARTITIIKQTNNIDAIDTQSIKDRWPAIGDAMKEAVNNGHSFNDAMRQASAA